MDAGGTVYIADTGNNVVRAISPSGHVTIAAGDGGRGLSPDAGPANHAEIDAPYSIASAPDGIYILDTGNRRVLRLSNGQVSTVYRSSTAN